MIFYLLALMHIFHLTHHPHKQFKSWCNLSGVSDMNTILSYNNDNLDAYSPKSNAVQWT